MPSLSLDQSNWLKRLFFKSGFILSILISLLIGIYTANCLKITKINYSGSISKSIINNLYEQNLLLLKTGSLKKRILEANPIIKSVQIIKKYPNELKIQAVLEKPFIQLLNNQEYLILNDQGKILFKQQKPNRALKTIHFYQILRSYETRIGNLIDDQNILYCVNLEKKIKNLSIQYNQIIIKKPQQVILPINDNALQIIISTKKPIDKNIIILQNIIKSIKIKGLKPKIINLEFEKPIITL